MKTQINYVYMKTIIIISNVLNSTRVTLTQLVNSLQGWVERCTPEANSTSWSTEEETHLLLNVVKDLDIISMCVNITMQTFFKKAGNDGCIDV